MLPDCSLQTEIARRPDVRPAEREEHINFRAPSPDALDRQQLGESGLILGPAEPGEIEFAAGDHLGERAGIAHLLAAKAARTKGRVVERQKGCGGQWAAELYEPAVHRCRGVDRHLLLEDDVQQCAKAIAAAAKPRRPGALQYLIENRLGSEDRDPFSETRRGIDWTAGSLPFPAHAELNPKALASACTSGRRMEPNRGERFAAPRTRSGVPRRRHGCARVAAAPNSSGATR